MATAAELQKLQNRSEQVGALPFESLQLAPLPKEIIKAFPALAEWEKQSNARIADFVKKMNVATVTNTQTAAP